MDQSVEYATIRRVLRIAGGKTDNVDIRIDFCNIPQKKRNQIEDAARKFLDLAEEILTKD